MRWSARRSRPGCKRTPLRAGLLARHYTLMSLHALFVEIGRAADSLPVSLREHVAEVTGLEGTRFDEAYIKFLDTQIRLGARGPEWTERLKLRREALLPFCGVTLVRGTVRVGDAGFTARVHPQDRVVIHWEEYDYDDTV